MPGIAKTMDEWEAGDLHSGSKKGPVVKSQKQALAIGLSEAKRAGTNKSKTSVTRTKLFGRPK